MRSAIPYIIELDGRCYTCQGDRIALIGDPREIQGDRCRISDLESAVSRVMTVESDTKYAEIMVNKKLQEMGEFDEPLTVIPHWKKQKGKNATEIFFTALPSRRFHQYRDMMQEDPAHVILFPLYAVLFKQLKQLRGSKPAAIVFQHGRFADMLIGTTKRVYYANRFVAFDTNEEQIESLWTTLRRDIESVVEENRLDLEHVYLLTWTDTIPPASWPEDARLKLHFLKHRMVTVDGEMRELSFPAALEKLPVSFSIAPGPERFFFWTHRAAPVLNAVMALMVLLLFAGCLWLKYSAERMASQAAAMRTELSRIEIAQPVDYSPEELDRTITFMKSLDYYRRAPAFRKIISDFSAGLSVDMIMESVKMIYSEGMVQVEAFGYILEPFEDAHQGYQRLLAGLRSSGYRIDEDRFNTKINRSSFLLKVSKQIQ